MKKFLLFLVITMFFFISLDGLAYYSFLSPESNTALGNLREKYKEREIILEKEHGLVWIVILPKNDRVEIKEARELVYNDETGKFEAVYNFTDIIITNPKSWTKIVWGSAAKFYPYNVPRIRFMFDS